MLCRKCYTPNTLQELRPSAKVKGLTVEESKKLKMCKVCKGRIFWTGGSQ